MVTVHNTETSGGAPENGRPVMHFIDIYLVLHQDVIQSPPLFNGFILMPRFPLLEGIITSPLGTLCKGVIEKLC